MHVEYPVPVGFEQWRSDETHEAGQADKRDATRAERVHDCAVVGVSVRVPARMEMEHLDARLARAPQPGGVLTIGHDDGDRGVETAVGDRVDERPKVAGARRGQE